MQDTKSPPKELYVKRYRVSTEDPDDLLQIEEDLVEVFDRAISAGVFKADIEITVTERKADDERAQADPVRS